MKAKIEIPEEYKDMGEDVKSLRVIALLPNKVKKFKTIDDFPLEYLELFTGPYAETIEGVKVIVFEHKDLSNPETVKKYTDAGIRLHSAINRGQ